MSIRKRLLSGGIARVILRVLSMVLMLALNGCLARWMTPSEMASYVTGINLLILISLIGMAGLDSSIIRLVAGRQKQDESGTPILICCWKIAAISSILVTMVAGFLLQTGLGDWMNVDPSIVIIILVCGLLISVHKVVAASLQSIHALVSGSFLEGRSGGPLSNSVYLLILVLFLSSGLTAATAFQTFALAMIITAPIGFWMLRKAIRRQDAAVRQRADQTVLSNSEAFETRSVVLVSLPFLASGLLTYFSSEFDVLLASAYASADETALFGTARRLVLQFLAPLQILTASVSSTIAEFHARGQREKLAKMLSYSATIGSTATIPLLLLCVAFPEWILSTVFGSFYANAAPVFVVMTIGPAINCLTGQCGNLLMLSGRTTVVLVVRIISAIVMVAGGALVTQAYGVYGLAVLTTTVTALQNIALWIAARVLTGYWTHATLRFRKVKVN